MSEFNFDELSRQSPKGIIINYGVLLYKLGKSFWVFIPLLFSDNIENKASYFSLIIGGLALFFLVVAFFQYVFFKFKISGDHFILHRGIIVRKKMSIPIDRIQSVNFKQNLIHQLINITQVEIQTAGAKDAEVEIKAISRTKAEALKSRLQSISVFEGKSDLGEKSTDYVEEKIIYRLSVNELFKVSFSENHIRSFFWIIAIIFSFGYQLEDIVKDWNFADKLVKFVVNNQSKITGSLLVLSVVFLGGLVISVIVSFVRVFLRHFDQKVLKKEDGIQVSEGLFTKREDVLKIKKVQYTITETNPIKQKLGIQTVRIKQAGSAKIKQKKQVALVGVRDEFLIKLKNLFFGKNSNIEKEENENDIQYKPANYYLFRMFVITFLFLAALNGFMYVNNFSLQNFILFNAMLIPISILLILLKFRKTYVRFEDKTLVVGEGKIGTVTKLMEYFKTQNIRYSQSFIQKRRGVATLKLQTASGVIKLPCYPQEQAREIKERILTEVENTTRDWI